MRLAQLIALALSAGGVSASCQTSIVAGQIEIDGVGTAYVAQTGGVDGKISFPDEESFSIPHNANRVYLTSSCEDSFGSDTFLQIPLLNKTISFDVNLASVNCGCNAALYLVAMPSSTSNDDYYCDSGQNSDPDCTEMDIVEANNHAWATTAHSCTPGNCDYWGYQKKLYSEVGSNSYGLGSGYAIDTSNTFHVTTSFYPSDDGSTLARIVTILSDDDNQATMVYDDDDYLSGLGDDIASGMVLSMSHWGSGSGGMSWLDSPPCSSSAQCDESGTVTFGDLKVHDIGVSDDDFSDDDNSSDDGDDDDGDDDDEPTCTVEENYDYEGNDLSFEWAADSSSCCAACAALDGCVAWSWADNYQSRCYYKYSSAGRTYKEGVISGTLDSAAKSLRNATTSR